MKKATKKVEGLRRNILYSKEKVRRHGIIRYWKIRIRQYKGSLINGNEINKLKNIYKINNSNSEELENVKIKLEEAHKS